MIPKSFRDGLGLSFVAFDTAGFLYKTGRGIRFVSLFRAANGWPKSSVRAGQDENYHADLLFAVDLLSALTLVVVIEILLEPGM